MICISALLTFTLVYFLHPLCLAQENPMFLKRGSWGHGSNPRYRGFMNDFLPVAVPDVTKHPNWQLLEHENCGTSMADRIIGGSNASLGQFPWLARIGYLSRNDDPGTQPNFKCGGALINKMYVLTAAHCVTSLPGKFIVASIRLGEHNALTDIDCEGPVCATAVQDFKPERLIVHKDYGIPPYKNDIALVRLDRPVYFNGWVQPICIPHGIQLVQNYEGTIAEVAGWGIYDMAALRSSDILQHVALPVVDINRCVVAFRHHAQIGPEQLCVGGIIGQDSCAGDSGGPLMKVDYIHGYPRFYILGIVSFGAKYCGATTMPAVYTKMAVYTEWLLNHLLP